MEIKKLQQDFIPELEEEEKKIWKILAPQLIELGIINTLNYILLIRYCSLFVRTQNVIKSNPRQTQTIKTLNKELQLMEDELCISPKAYNRWKKDRLIIEIREGKTNKKKEVDEEDEEYLE